MEVLIVNNENIPSEVVSSFIRNGKLYMIIELDITSSLTDNQAKQFMDVIPSPDDFRFEFELQGDQVCIVLYYKNEEKWRKCFKIDCITKEKISLFSISILVGQVEIYLKNISVCPEDGGARVKLELAGQAPGIGEKTILSLDRKIP